MEGHNRKLRGLNIKEKSKRLFDYLIARPTLSAFIAVLMLASVATAGSLTPTSAPASTFNTLEEIYDSIASDSFDSSGFAASTSGSLINHLLYIEQNLGWASISNNLSLIGSGNVGIGDSSPEVKFEVVGAASVSQLFIGGTVFNPNGPTSMSATFEITGDGTVNNLLKLTDNSVGSTFALTVNDGDFQIRSSDSTNTFASEDILFSIASQSGGVKIGTTRKPVTVGALEGTGSVNLGRVGTPWNVDVSGKYAYVTSGFTDSLSIIDISDPSSPSFVGKIADGGTGLLDSVFEVKVVGRYAYVTTQSPNMGLTIVDVSNPTNPEIVGRISGAGTPNFLDFPLGLYVSGKYAYIAAQGGDDSLTIIDVSNPTDPTFAGRLADAGTMDNAQAVYVSGKYAYVAASADDALNIIDVSDPTNPTLTGSISGAGSPNFLDGAGGVYASDRYAYVTSIIDDSLSIFDVSDPTNPSFVGNISGSGAPNFLNGAADIRVMGDYAYVIADNDDSLTIIDISDPTNPTFVNNISGANSPNFLDAIRGLDVSGRYAFAVSGNDHSFTVIDLGGLDTPTLSAGDINTSSVEVYNNVDIGNDLYVRGGGVFGRGLFVNGSFAISVASLSDNTSSTSTANLFSISHAKGYFAGDALLLDLAAATSQEFFTGNFARMSLAGTDLIIFESSGAILASGAAQFGAAGAPSSTSFSRFGSGLTSNGLSDIDDVLISADLEVNGVLYADGGCVGCGGGGVGTDSLDFDDFVDAMTLDADLTIASGGFTWDFTDIDIEGAGTASLSNVFIASASEGRVYIGDLNDGQGSAGTAAQRNSVLDIAKTETSTVAGTALNIQSLWDFSSDASGISGLEINTQTKDTNSNNMTGSMTGIIARTDHSGSGTATALTGINASAKNAFGGTVTTATGLYSSAGANGGITLEAQGIVAQNLLLNLGVVSRSYNFISRDLLIGSGTVINAAGFVSEEIDSATNNTNLLLGTTTIPSGSYSIYNASTRSNFFGGGASWSGNLTPTADDTYSLGLSALRWSELFVASGSLHIGADGNDSSITYETSSGSIDFMAFQPDGVYTEFRIFEGGNASISGNFEVGGELIATTINISSISGNLEITGYASASQYFSGGLIDCDGTTDKLAWTASGSEAGKFSCLTDQDTGSTNGWVDDGTVIRLATDTDNVGIGTSTPVSILDVSDANAPGVVTLSRRDTSVSANEDIGRLDFWNNDTQLTTQNLFARILVEADSTIGDDAADAHMSFLVTGTTVGGSPVERMRIDPTGFIGIGTSAPIAHLDIELPSGVTGTLFRVASGSSERFRIDSDGNIGVNSTTPEFALEVQGDTHPEGSAVFYGNVGIGQDNNSWGASAYDAVSDANKAVLSIRGAQFSDADTRVLDVSIYTNTGTPDFVIRGDGNASSSGNWEWTSGYVKVDDGTRTAPSIRFDTNSVHNNRGIYYNTGSGYNTINIVGENLQHASFDVFDGTICFETHNGNPICNESGTPKLYVQGLEGPNDIISIASSNGVTYFRVNETGTFNAGGNGVTPTNNTDYHSIGSFGNVTGYGTTFINSGDDLRVDGSIELYTGSLLIDNTGVISIPRGSAGAPSYSFNTGNEAGMDTDTGMWSSAANIINFSTGGVERMEINADGNVGINDSTPVSTLDILASGSASVFRVASGSTNELMEIFGNGNVLIHGIATPIGNVGIGTSVTTQAFVTIQGVTNFTGAAALLIEDNNGTDNFVVYDHGDASLSGSFEAIGNDFGVGPLTRGAPPSGQSVRMDLSELSFRGGVSGPSMAFNAYFDNSDYRYISTETAFKIEQDQTNNVLEFEYAVAGTAGNIVSWTNGITMNTSGNVGINAGVLQVSGTTFVAYNRYGSGTTNHGLTGTSDLLISDDLEINGVLYADTGIVVNGGDITLNGNSITGGGSFGGTSISVSGGGSFGASISATEFLAGDGSATAPSFTFSSAEKYGMYKDGGTLAFSVAGTKEGFFQAGSLQVTGFVDSVEGYKDNGTTGVDRNCAANEFLGDQTVSGGIVTAGSCETDDVDYAERFYAGEAEINPGDVIVADPRGGIDIGIADAQFNQAVIKSTEPYQGTVVGIVSTKPGLIIGSKGDAEHPTVEVALAGRVPVKVTGTVRVGDMLTSSELSGIAMRATQPGMVVGMALTEAFFEDGQEYVMAFVNPQYWAPSIDLGEGTILEDLGVSESFLSTIFDVVVAMFGDVLGINFEEGKIATDKAEFNEVKTEVLCVGDVCVTQDELRSLLDAGDVQPADNHSDESSPVSDEDTEDVSGDDEPASDVADDEEEDVETDEDLDTDETTDDSDSDEPAEDSNSDDTDETDPASEDESEEEPEESPDTEEETDSEPENTEEQ